MSCHAHRLCAHCVIAMHCSVNCSTPPLCPKKPPRLTAVLVALRRQQRRTVVPLRPLTCASQICLRQIALTLWSHSISRYFVCVDQVIAKTTWIIFLAVGRCTGTTPARQWGRTHRNTANLRPPSRVPSRGTRERGRRIETGAAEQGSVERKNAGRLTKRRKLHCQARWQRASLPKLDFGW